VCNLLKYQLLQNCFLCVCDLLKYQLLHALVYVQILYRAKRISVIGMWLLKSRG
jgi:hypothetical protein